MRDYALFFNGVYEDVLADILSVQSFLPEQILYLQPYKREPIVRLAENPPTVDVPVRALFSVTDDLPHVHFGAEIVGWDHKSNLGGEKLMNINRIIYMFQRTEPGVYMEVLGHPCINLLHVRRMMKFSRPFSVDQLTLVSSGEPVSMNRTQAGGWSYVTNPEDSWLAQWL